jgi:glucose/mannose-6-phosphate isomerase
VNLDEPERFAEVDLADALGDVERTSRQWAEAGEIDVPRIDLAGLDAVVVSGVGGSGICGDVVAAIAQPRLPVPLVVHKGYGLPAFVGPGTLVVAVSCSGNTEETRSAAETALGRGARLLVVAQGGGLASLCEERAVPFVRIETSCQPRHSLGMLVVPVLAALGVDEGVTEAIAVLDEIAAACGRSAPLDQNPAKRLGLRLASGGVPVVYGGQGLGAVAGYRLKCQLNENAKLPSVFGELPEAGHNEIVGWSEPVPGLAGARGGLVTLRDTTGEHPRVARRIDATVDLLDERFDWHEELRALGEAPLARLASLLLLADFASVYTALALDRDPTPIDWIDRVKTALSGETVRGEGP